MTKGKGAVSRVSTQALKPAADDRKIGKRKPPVAPAGVDKSSKRKVRKERRAKKDPNKPKRAASAFFFFLEEFRQTFKKENPDVKAVSAVGKAGGAKWKTMSAEDKAPYEAKAAKKKAEYEKLMTAYNNKQLGRPAAADSNPSKSEVNDEDDEATAEEGHEEGDEEEEEEEEEEEDDEEDDD